MNSFKDYLDTMQGAIEIFRNHDLGKFTMALDSNDNPCDVMSEDAQKFSISGAILRVCELNKIPQHHFCGYVIEFLQTHSGYDFLTWFNDDDKTTKQDILDLLEECIRRLNLACNHQQRSVI